MYISVLPTHIPVYHVNAWCPHRLEEVMDSSDTKIADGYEIELSSFERAVRAFNCWTISLASVCLLFDSRGQLSWQKSYKPTELNYCLELYSSSKKQATPTTGILPVTALQCHCIAEQRCQLLCGHPTHEAKATFTGWVKRRCWARMFHSQMMVPGCMLDIQKFPSLIMKVRQNLRH